MKTLETNHNNDWRDQLLNIWPFLIDSESIYSLFRCGICRNENLWHAWGTTDTGSSLFYNGAVFVRVMLPFWIGIHIRFGKRYLQAGLGWKLNGRFGIICRIQTDESSAQGTHGPNYGQASGWDCGTK